ncbi:hypothetical protein BC826DRAFT_710107 [Russula brevipes]|nr:hypothetical protein BC826DRAFT_710107 [Russula brevipes]
MDIPIQSAPLRNPRPASPQKTHNAPHPQLRLDCSAVDDTDHDGDDEQEEHDHSDGPSPLRSHLRSRPHSPHALPTTQQQQQQPTPPAPSPCAAHMHFHTWVRITSGLWHSHANMNPNTNHTLNDSSDSDSTSSSISALLRFCSRDTGPRAPLTKRVSRLATQAWQKRRAAAWWTLGHLVVVHVCRAKSNGIRARGEPEVRGYRRICDNLNFYLNSFHTLMTLFSHYNPK